MRKTALLALGERLSALLIDELLSDAELPGGAERIEALVDLAASTRPNVRARAVEVARAAAEELDDHTAKSRLLLNLALLEPPSARPVTVRRAFDSASQIQATAPRSSVLGAIAGSIAGWDSLSVVEMLQHQLPALAARTRKDVLSDICALASVISQGDAFAPAAVFDAVVDVNRWWP